MPFPDDETVLHGSGPDPDRILLVGGNFVRGFGVRSHELGIAGNLARKLAARTGHGADVEAHGVEMMTPARAGEELSALRIQRFDAIVLMIGAGEVLTMRPMSEWRNDLQDLLRVISDLGPNAPPVLIAAVPPFAAVFHVSDAVRARIARAIDRINKVTRRVCAESGAATFVDFGGTGPAPTAGTRVSDAYETWASALATPLAQAMASAPHEIHTHFVPVDEGERQHALDKLGVIGSDPDAIVNHIVEMARDMLGVPAASLTLIDHDRQWTMSASGIRAEDIPRSEAICNTTIQTPGVYIVEDASTSPEFQNASWVAGTEHIRSYAGYPVEAPGGQRVGALCVMDRSPRHFTPDDVATLRDLALRAQHELWMAAAG
ncbi:MAG: GAF domain-containing protein [Pseudolysinimonas sp.]